MPYQLVNVDGNDVYVPVEVLSFGGPQGNQGVQGINGSQGTQGTQGVQGTNLVSNPNILINTNGKNMINQRGYVDGAETPSQIPIL